MEKAEGAEASSRGGARRGRRPAGSGARDAIFEAARRRFAEQGYPKTTLRAIAADAGVDTRLVSHYFGSKQELFVSVVELPFDPEAVFRELAAGGSEGIGERVARFVVTLLGVPEARQTITGVIRAAVSEDAAAAMVRTFLLRQVLLPIASQLGVDHAELRASMLGSQFAGLVLARHIVGLPELVDVDPEVLIALLGPVIQHYFTGDIAPRRTPAPA